MSKYKGAKYIGEDPIHLPNGELILKNEITDFISAEAADNDNLFEPVYESKKKEIKKKENKKSDYEIKPEKKDYTKKYKKDGIK